LAIRVFSTEKNALQFEVTVKGIAAYLDNFALIDLASRHNADRADRFRSSVIRTGGSLLFSAANAAELAALTGDSAARVRSFLAGFGPHWTFVEVSPFTLMEREAAGKKRDTCLSLDLMTSFWESRMAELEEASRIVDLSADTFFRLDAVMNWLASQREAMIRNTDQLDAMVIELVDHYRQLYDRDRTHFDRALPATPFRDDQPATFVYHNILRNVVANLKGHPLKHGDGRDLCHAVVGAAYGSFATLDKHWKRRIEFLPKPNGLARIYYAPELDQLVNELESASARR
jgi:hypothetical protein